MLITIDGLLVEGVDKVARVLNGVLEVAHGVSAAAFAPHALLGRLGLVLQLAQPGLVWTGHTHTQYKFTFGAIIDLIAEVV